MYAHLHTRYPSCKEYSAQRTSYLANKQAGSVSLCNWCGLVGNVWNITSLVSVKCFCFIFLVLSWGRASLTYRKQLHEKAHFKSFSDFSSQMKDELSLIYQLMYKKMSEYFCQSFYNLKMLLTVLPNFSFSLKASNLFLGMNLHSKNLSSYLLKIL